MSQLIVAFVGISGAGKTTFLRKLAEKIDFQHVTAGSLITAARNAAPERRDSIRHANLDENQRLLIEGFVSARDPKAELVILDGHVVIDNGERLIKIPADVFKALGISVMVHLEAEPQCIAANRSRDINRARPVYRAEVLLQHQESSKAHARAVAKILGVDFLTVEYNDVGRFIEIMRKNITR